MPVPATPSTDLDLIEAFSSIQGEGLLVGVRQIFLRFPECNLTVRYCDTPFQPTSHCTVEDPPGSGNLLQLNNPVCHGQLVEIFNRWCFAAPNVHHSFSITGGEPLLHATQLKEWLLSLRKLLPIYLETNGILLDQLELLISQLDWVAMDIKLESQTGQATDWKTHRKFLKIANRTNCYVKIVVGNDTSEAELHQAAKLINEVSDAIPLILQPVTKNGKVGVSVQQLLTMQQHAAKFHSDVRVVPQTHVFLGVM